MSRGDLFETESDAQIQDHCDQRRNEPDRIEDVGINAQGCAKQDDE